jgi:hypothetical protein
MIIVIGSMSWVTSQIGSLPRSLVLRESNRHLTGPSGTMWKDHTAFHGCSGRCWRSTRCRARSIWTTGIA